MPDLVVHAVYPVFQVQCPPTLPQYLPGPHSGLGYKRDRSGSPLHLTSRAVNNVADIQLTLCFLHHPSSPLLSLAFFTTRFVRATSVSQLLTRGRDGRLCDTRCVVSGLGTTLRLPWATLSGRDMSRLAFLHISCANSEDQSQSDFQECMPLLLSLSFLPVLSGREGTDSRRIISLSVTALSPH